MYQTMSKMKLTKIDKQRLAELIVVYMNPAAFFIHGSGMVTLTKANWFKRMFNVRDEFDTEFIAVTKEIMAGVLEEKGANPLNHKIATRIGAILLNTYDISEIVRLLYLMHIIEEGDITVQKQNMQNSNQSRPKSIEVKIEQVRQDNTRQPSIGYFGPGMSRNDCKLIVESLLNEADLVLVNDSRY